MLGILCHCWDYIVTLPSESHNAFFRGVGGGIWPTATWKTPFRQTGELHIKGKAKRNLEIWWREAALCSTTTWALLGVMRVHWEPARKSGWRQKLLSSGAHLLIVIGLSNKQKLEICTLIMNQNTALFSVTIRQLLLLLTAAPPVLVKQWKLLIVLTARR